MGREDNTVKETMDSTEVGARLGAETEPNGRLGNHSVVVASGIVSTGTVGEEVEKTLCGLGSP